MKGGIGEDKVEIQQLPCPQFPYSLFLIKKY